MNLSEVHQKFSTSDQCLTYIQQMRWPDGIVRCPTCGDSNVKRYERPETVVRKRRSDDRDADKRNVRKWFFICLNADCRQQFSPTSGTIFNDTHLPLIVWFQAIALVLNARKGLSAMQLKRDLGVSYKTAWYLYHRIREIMNESDIPKLGGIVEIDETYVGGKQKGKGVFYGKRQKQVVMGAVQRGGSLKLQHVANARSKTVREFLIANISQRVKRIMTDESSIYPAALYNHFYSQMTHETVNHIAGEYSRGDVTTNSIENVFSLFKRGVIGQYHKISAKHLQRYLNETAYRFNRRKEDAFAETVIRLCGFKPLTFASLTSEPE